MKSWYSPSKTYLVVERPKQALQVRQSLTLYDCCMITYFVGTVLHLINALPQVNTDSEGSVVKGSPFMKVAEIKCPTILR